MRGAKRPPNPVLTQDKGFRRFAMARTPVLTALAMVGALVCVPETFSADFPSPGAQTSPLPEEAVVSIMIQKARALLVQGNDGAAMALLREAAQMESGVP